MKMNPMTIRVASSGSSLAEAIFPVALSRTLNNSTAGFGMSVRVLESLIMQILSIYCCLRVGHFISCERKERASVSLGYLEEFGIPCTSEYRAFLSLLIAF